METRAYERVNYVHAADLRELEAWLASAHYKVFRMDGRLMRDKATFLTVAEKCLPMPVGGPFPEGSWDAFIDCLWQGFEGGPARRGAILWCFADRVYKHGYHDLTVGLECLETVSEQLEPGDERVGRAPIDIKIFLIGESKPFQRAVPGRHS